MQLHGLLRAGDFGQDADWESPLLDVFLWVELPFYIFVPWGDVEIDYGGISTVVRLCPPYYEEFIESVTDSKQSRAYMGPHMAKPRQRPAEVQKLIDENDVPVMERNCKTVLRISAKCHEYFLATTEYPLPRHKAEIDAYLASLAEGYLPLVNELIQRYRLATYDYFAYELSPWDVPVWTIGNDEHGARLAHLLPYSLFDVPPVFIGRDSQYQAISYAERDALSEPAAEQAGPGEFELLDARSAMERGDYTGAVRRTVTAIEVLVRALRLDQLRAAHGGNEATVLRELDKTRMRFDKRLKDWSAASGREISQGQASALKELRDWRHRIVHSGQRVNFDEVNRAQRLVDMGRWLFNCIEDRPERAKLRDTDVRKSFGRRIMSSRFATAVEDGDLIVQRPEAP
jgi:hypothetical protein